jgi:hypothetical protein
MTTPTRETTEPTPTTEPTAAVTTRNDGKAFERRFAALMRERLGVRRTRLRVQVKGKVGARPHECDVHGEVYSPIWDVVSYLGIAVTLLAFACLFQSWFPEEAARLGIANVWLTRLATGIEARATIIHPSVSQYAVAILGIGCSLLAGHAKDRVERHIWTECKDRRSTVKRKDITDLASTVANVRAEDSGAPWRPDEIWFASTSKFDQDALAFARELRIRCLQVAADGTIVELTTGR